jgi:uncharacterized protein YlxW (UPF0749 family)
MTWLLLNWKWVLSGAVLLGIVIFVAYFQSLRAENERMAKELEENKVMIQKLSRSLLDNQLALNERIETIKKLHDEKQATISGLKELYKNDNEACAWSQEKIPDNVFKMLCQ